MAIADTVYYEDQDVRITRQKLVLYGVSYQMAAVQAVEIVTMKVLQSPFPAWVTRVLSWNWLFLVAVLLLTDPFKGMYIEEGWPQEFRWSNAVLGVVILYSIQLIKKVADFYRGRPVVDIPVLRFHLTRPAGSDLQLASMDQKYLLGIKALISQVVQNQDVEPRPITPPVVVVTATTAGIGDHEYALADIKSASYEKAADKYTFRGSLLTWLALFVFNLSWSLELNFAVCYASIALALVYLVYAALSIPKSSVYVLVLKGRFGTLYPFACSSLLTIQNLVQSIKKAKSTNQQPPQPTSITYH